MARLLRLSEVRATAEGTQPAGYRLAGRGHLDLPLLTVLSLVAFPPALLCFAWLTRPGGGPFARRAGGVSPSFGPLDLLLVVVAALVVLPVLHELVHGAAAALCGGRPVYGIGPGVAFCHFREFVGKWPYAAILVAPLLVVSLAGLLAMPVAPGLLRGPILALLVTNASGAVGDLAALCQLIRLPRAAIIADTSGGFEFYLPAGDGVRRAGDEGRGGAG